MRTVGYRLSARTISLALVAAFIALEAPLAVRTGSLGISRTLSVRVVGEGAETPERAGTHDGGESSIAKRHEPTIAPKPAAAEATEARPASRRRAANSKVEKKFP